MNRIRYNSEQIAFVLRQAESGTAVEEVCEPRWASPSRGFTGARSSSLEWA